MALIEPEKYPEKYSDRKNRENDAFNLQNKIREQAKRLNSMQEYINLLEQKNKKYNPTQKFPLTNQNDPELSYHQLSQKYNSLQKKYKELFNSSKQNNLLQNNNNDENEEIECTKENIKKLNQEKEEILSQLKQEIINNDEQRNYIEILKQALETNISKHGLKDQINFLKNKYYQNSDKDDYASVILDLSKLKEKNDVQRIFSHLLSRNEG